MGSQDTGWGLEIQKEPCYTGVSNNRGAPKWMVKIMENPIQMDDLRVPLFLETPIQSQKASFFLEGSQLADSFSVPVSKFNLRTFGLHDPLFLLAGLKNHEFLCPFFFDAGMTEKIRKL